DRLRPPGRAGGPAALLRVSRPRGAADDRRADLRAPVRGRDERRRRGRRRDARDVRRCSRAVPAARRWDVAHGHGAAHGPERAHRLAEWGVARVVAPAAGGGAQLAAAIAASLEGGTQAAAPVALDGLDRAVDVLDSVTEEVRA